MLAFGVSTALAALPTNNVVSSTTGNETTFYIRGNGSGIGYFWNANTSPTRTAANYAKFAFYAVDGVANAYYIKNVTAGKWLSYNNTAIASGKNFVTLVDAQENYFIVQKNSNYYWIRPVNTSGNADNYINWNGGIGTGSSQYPVDNTTMTIGLWNSWGDRGSQWILVQTDKVLTDASQIQSNKYYTIAPFRGGLSVTADGTTATTRNSGDEDENADKWAFITYGGTSYYLFNLKSQTFLKGDVSMGALTDAFTISDFGTSADGYFKFHFNQGSNTINGQNSGLVINSYSSPDDGNRMMIVEIGDFDDSNVDALIANAAAAELAIYKNTILQRIAPLSFLTTYNDVVANINAATNEAGVQTALAGINNFITIKNYQNSSNYLEAGNPNASYNSSPSDHSNYIQLVSAGNGEFYLKGYKSQRYIGDVATSVQVTTDATPTTSFWIQQNADGRYILRPAKYGSFTDQSGYHYLHNNGCVGWEASANNSQHLLAEVADPDAEVNVTYALYYLNEKINEVTAKSGLGLSPVAPDAFVRDFVDLAVENTTITTANQTIRVDATWTGPFELNADFASIAKWYDMSIRNTWYVTSDNKDGDGALKTVNANAMGLAEDAYQWAFVGNPYNIKLYNKAEGGTKAFAWTSTANSSIPAFVDAATANSWWVRKSTTSDQATYSNAFLLTVPEYGWQVNQFGGEGGSLKVWQSNGTHDAGSAFKVFDVPDDFSEYAVAEILPYLETSGYYALTDAAKAEIGWDDSFSTSCPFAAYKAMKQALQAKLADESNLKKPGTGYYRLQSKYYPGKYMSYRIFDDNGTVSHSICAVDNSSDITSIIKLTSLGSNKYTLSIEGAYVPVPKTSTKMELADAPVEFTAINSHLGAAAFNTNNQEEDRDRAIHCANTQDYYCVGWTYNAEASEWTVDDATTFSITMHAGESNYWATLNAPFGVVLPDGTEAYVGIRDGGNLVLTSIGTNVPANTPVVLKGNAASITATINDEIPAINIANDLQGQNQSQTGENESLLSLGIYDGVVGFYQYEGIIGANKAYLNNTAGSGANGYKFVFADEDPTAVNGVKAASEAATYFDLFGRKVVAPAKGNLYIQNGKVVKY